MSTADPREPATTDDAQGPEAQAALAGLAREAAACTVATYFAAFPWNATLDPMTMSAEAFLGAAFTTRARRG